METIHRFTEEEFDRLFRSRGIEPEVVAGAFYRYQQGESVDVQHVFGHATSWAALPELPPAVVKYAKRCTRLATKSPGMMMIRFPVPGANPLILNEQRPDRAIWVGDPSFASWMGGIPEPHTHGEIFSDDEDREDHVTRGKTTPTDVFNGMTPTEYRLVSDVLTAPNYGGDHFDEDTKEPHVHIRVAKYTFERNEQGWAEDPDGPHKHSSYKTEEGLGRHLGRWHQVDSTAVGGAQDKTSWNRAVRYDPLTGYLGLSKKRSTVDQMIEAVIANDVEFDTLHRHYRQEPTTRYATRLSWHPYRREERWWQDRVFIAAEGCLKEAALVSAGVATASFPSVTLWHAPELETFARTHLTGKRVYIVCDSDWDPAVRRLNDDKVISQMLLLQDELIRLGVDAHVAAPPQPVEAGCTDEKHLRDGKHGVDDHLGPCNPLGVDDLLEVIVTPRNDLRELLTMTRQGQRGRWQEGLERDLEVLTWLSRYTANGRCRLSFRSIARTIQHWLGAEEEDGQPAFENKVDKVGVAVNSLVEADALLQRGSIKDRIRYHFGRRRAEWTGSLELAPAYRSDVSTRPIGHNPGIQ